MVVGSGFGSGGGFTYSYLAPYVAFADYGDSKTKVFEPDGGTVGSAVVKIISAESGRIIRVSVNLKPQQTALKVLSEPSETEAYFNASPGKSRWPDQVTPAVFENVQAEKVKLTLFKPGYFDTSFTVNLLKNRENAVSINMITADSSYKKNQNRFVLQRKQRRIGLSLSIGSVACILKCWFGTEELLAVSSQPRGLHL